MKKESFCAYLNTPLTCKECKKTTLKKSAISSSNDTDRAARSYRSVGIVCLLVDFLHLKCERCVQAIFEYEETLSASLGHGEEGEFLLVLEHTAHLRKECKRTTLKKSRQD